LKLLEQKEKEVQQRVQTLNQEPDIFRWEPEAAVEFARFQNQLQQMTFLRRPIERAAVAPPSPLLEAQTGDVIPDPTNSVTISTAGALPTYSGTSSFEFEYDDDDLEDIDNAPF